MTRPRPAEVRVYIDADLLWRAAAQQAFDPRAERQIR